MGATPKPHLSFSQLKTAAQCGEEYRLKYVEGLAEEQENLPAVVGTAMHAAVEEFESRHELVTGIDMPPQRKMDLWYDLTNMTKKSLHQYMDANDLSASDLLVYGGQNMKKFQTDLIPKMTEAYLEQRWSEIDTGFQWGIKKSGALSSEIECLIDIGGVEVLAYIDQLFLDSMGRHVIRDLKTGSPRAGHAMQLEFYHYALFKKTGIQCDYGQLLYVKNGKLYVQVVKFSLHPDDIERMIRRLVSQIGDNSFTINGPFTDHCKICSVRSNCVYGSVGVHGSS